MAQTFMAEKSLHLLLEEAMSDHRNLLDTDAVLLSGGNLSDELIQVMKEEPKICHYLDLPIQHASDEILSRMGRRTTKQELD